MVSDNKMLELLDSICMFWGCLFVSGLFKCSMLLLLMFVLRYFMIGAFVNYGCSIYVLMYLFQ